MSDKLVKTKLKDYQIKTPPTENNFKDIEKPAGLTANLRTSDKVLKGLQDHSLANALSQITM